MIPKFKAHQIEEPKKGKDDDHDHEFLKEIEANFRPADDAIDRFLLNEITGEKADGETVKKDDPYGLDVSGRSLFIDEE